MIKRKWLRVLAFLLVLAGLAAAAGGLLLPALDSRAASGDEPTRQADGGGLAPTISFIDSPSATCTLPTPGTDVCFVQWQYMYVTASSGQYIITSTMALDGRLQAYVGGFFQTYMYLPSSLTDPGFRVSCGAPGASGVPTMGLSHSYVIRARETGGLAAANYGSVLCPYDVVPAAAITLSGPEAGIPGEAYTFDASLLPITTTLPITYTWLADDLAPTVIVSGTSASASFTWSAEGDKTVTVTAENWNSSISATRTIAIRMDYLAYLPLVRR